MEACNGRCYITHRFFLLDQRPQDEHPAIVGKYAAKLSLPLCHFNRFQLHKHCSRLLYSTN